MIDFSQGCVRNYDLLLGRVDELILIRLGPSWQPNVDRSAFNPRPAPTLLYILDNVTEVLLPSNQAQLYMT